jgi:hypothetical protein
MLKRCLDSVWHRKLQRNVTTLQLLVGVSTQSHTRSDTWCECPCGLSLTRGSARFIAQDGTMRISLATSTPFIRLHFMRKWQGSDRPFSTALAKWHSCKSRSSGAAAGAILVGTFCVPHKQVALVLISVFNSRAGQVYLVKCQFIYFASFEIVITSEIGEGSQERDLASSAAFLKLACGFHIVLSCRSKPYNSKARWVRNSPARAPACGGAAPRLPSRFVSD